MSSLRAILGGGKVTKRKSSSSKSSPRNSTGASPSSRPRPKATTSSSSSSTKPSGSLPDDLYNPYTPLPNRGPPRRPADTFSTVPEALSHAQTTMFDPLPTSHAGMNSVRTATVLNYRAALPPVTSVPHLTALLATSGGTPTALARTVEQAVQTGLVRRVLVPRRGGPGETVIPAAALEGMVGRARAQGLLDRPTADAFLAYLGANPAAARVPPHTLSTPQADALVRAGFLTAHSSSSASSQPGDPAFSFSFSRPEDRYTLMSLETVSRAGASGTPLAVGGSDVIHASGGTGVRCSSSSSAAQADLQQQQLALAVPGNGTYLKLVSAAVAHLAALLGKARFREMPESALREAWDGGVAGEAEDDARRAKRGRGEFAGVMPGRTKKWRDFYGLRFGWVLDEALGSGVVEVFETGSVGRGVRLV